jgi:hypothetical protein
MLREPSRKERSYCSGKKSDIKNKHQKQTSKPHIKHASNLIFTLNLSTSRKNESYLRVQTTNNAPLPRARRWSKTKTVARERLESSAAVLNNSTLEIWLDPGKKLLYEFKNQVKIGRHRLKIRTLTNNGSRQSCSKSSVGSRYQVKAKDESADERIVTLFIGLAETVELADDEGRESDTKRGISAATRCSPPCESLA